MVNDAIFPLGILQTLLCLRPSQKERAMPIQGDDLKQGWGVVCLKPWHLAGIFQSSIDAENLAAKLGAGYVVKFGEHASGSPEFSFDNLPKG